MDVVPAVPAVTALLVAGDRGRADLNVGLLLLPVAFVSQPSRETGTRAATLVLCVVVAGCWVAASFGRSTRANDRPDPSARVPPQPSCRSAARGSRPRGMPRRGRYSRAAEEESRLLLSSPRFMLRVPYPRGLLGGSGPLTISRFLPGRSLTVEAGPGRISG
jgi:hypothetical protein